MEITFSELISLIETPKENAKGNLERYGGINGLSDKLNVNLKIGLSEKDEKDQNLRKSLFGENYIPPSKSKSIFQLMIEAAQDVTIMVLCAAGVISLILGLTVDEHPETGWIEGASIMFAVVLVIMITALNDYQKEKQFKALNAVKDLELIKVIRDGQPREVPMIHLLVGDIVRVDLGDILPADGIAFDCIDVKVDESAMTGESDLIGKNEIDKPFFLSGTKVMEGVGKMMVTCVGKYSQAGIISTLVQGGKVDKQTEKAKDSAKGEDVYVNMESPKNNDTDMDTSEEVVEIVSPLQGKLDKLTIFIAKAGTGVSILVLLVLAIWYSIEHFAVNGNAWKGSDAEVYLGYFIIAVTILVVAIPEGLPLAVTISLAYSVKKMLKDNNFVRHLDACETMGSATTICSDKTGTLTTNRMTVMKTWIGGQEYSPVPKDLQKECKLLFTNGVCVNSTAEILPPKTEGGLPEHTGNKTECALLQLCDTMGEKYADVRNQTNIDRMITFSSLKKRMSVVVQHEQAFRVYTKGATEVVLGLCTKMLNTDGTISELSLNQKTEINKNVIEKYAQQGFRTLCLAYRDMEHHDVSDDELESNLTCVAIVGIEDPVRQEVPGAIEQCRKAGVTVRMVTGDNISTARSIATKCGIIGKTQNEIIMEGKEFRQKVLDKNGNIIQAEFDKIWPNLRVLARSSPTDKHTLVSGIIQANVPSLGPQVVAVTGDGTNDAPALKKADVGFAMGISGTAVAKDASDIILMDDNFISIVNAVKWGRNVYDSISKFLQFQLTVNVVAVLVATIGAFTIQDTPLTAIQLLWVNLIMDTFASLALATEKPTDALLDRQPYARTKPLISKKMMKHIFGQAFFQLIVLNVIIFKGDSIFDIKSGRKADREINDSDDGRDPTTHYTIVFNSFVFMQLFNQLNSRKVHDEMNIFTGLITNEVFLSVIVFEVVAQIIIVQFGGIAFGTKGLSISHWLVCIGLGFLSLPIGAILRLVKTDHLPKWMGLYREPTPPVTEAKGTRGQQLWMRGLTRIRAQIRVVNAFKKVMQQDAKNACHLQN